MTQRILVVDDDPRWCRTLGQIVEDMGYEVRTVTCLSEAKQFLGSHEFVLALVDIDLDGLGLAGEGGQLFYLLCEQYPQTPVVAITATSPNSKQMRDLFVECNIRDFVNKDDFNLKRVRELIRKEMKPKSCVDSQDDAQVTQHRDASPTSEIEQGLSHAVERASLKEELAQHKRNLYTLREQAAVFAAGDTPLHLLNQIEAEKEEIQRIEAELEGLER